MSCRGMLQKAYSDNGGGGGGLGYKNNIGVTPGQSYAVQVGNNGQNAHGEPSFFVDAATVQGQGGPC